MAQPIPIEPASFFPRWIRKTRTAVTWLKRERAFRAYLKRALKAIDQTPVSSEIGIVIQPFLGTPMPWFLIVLGVLLRERGRRVCFIWDDTVYTQNKKLDVLCNNSIGRVLESLPTPFRYVRLSSYPQAASLRLTEDRIEEFARLNSVKQYLRETETEETLQAKAVFAAHFRRSAAHAQTLLEQESFEYLLAGGGLFSSTSVFLHTARHYGLRVATVDAGEGVMLACSDGIAANLDDIPRAVELMGNDDWAVTQGKEEMQRRTQGRDTFSYQAVVASEKTAEQAGEVGLLLPLNQSFDTSALGRHRIFTSQADWILQTAEWVVNATDQTITVRRHPVERRRGLRSHDDYEGMLKERFGDHPRVRYIAEDAPINTYDLLDKAIAVIPYVSTVGVEGVALDKPVVTHSNCCYANLGFVWNAPTREAYFDLLGQAVRGELQVTEEQRNAAWRCYYLTQCCNFVVTPFTPMPKDFSAWVTKDPLDSIRSGEIADILEAIDTNVPLAYLRHRRRKADSGIEVGK